MKSCKKIVAALIATLMLVTLSPLVSNKTEAASTTVGEVVTAYGKKFMGVPYVFGGTTPRGFDCSGFTQYIFKHAAGISLPRTAEQQYNVGKAVSKSDLQPGDLIFYANTYKKGISHVGVYAGGNMVLNATSSSGIALVSMNNSYWGPKYAGAKRVITDQDWFVDVAKSDVSYAAIKSLTEKEVIAGFDNLQFRPDANVTRGQAAAIINRVLGITPNQISHFRDVGASYQFAEDIAAMKEAGIINGFSDGTFKAGAYMTRDEMASIIKRAFNLAPTQSAAASVKYTDIRSTHWAYDGIIAIASSDRTGYYAGTRYNGTKDATREAFAVAIYNAAK
ncbi:C40 family peptidase [Domibacillus indicus]|uniref:C40 family peptidase n=1 Tax=Domibacillus indicus TaxID=1437523 RepID=UPI000696E691|nr:C40 family peptidase [Domibacillus indicus]